MELESGEVGAALGSSIVKVLSAQSLDGLEAVARGKVPLSQAEPDLEGFVALPASQPVPGSSFEWQRKMQDLLPQMCQEDVSAWVVNHMEDLGKALGLLMEGHESEARSLFQKIEGGKEGGKGRPKVKQMGTSDEVVDCSHGKQLWELCKEKYEPLWLKGGNHCDLELYPEYIRHLKKFVSTVEKSPSQRNSSRRSTDRFEQSRRSTDCFEAPRKSTDRREKPRQSTDRPEKMKSHESKSNNVDKLEKLRISFDQMERSRRSVDWQEKSRRSIDHQLERARKSVDRNPDDSSRRGHRSEETILTFHWLPSKGSFCLVVTLEGSMAHGVQQQNQCGLPPLVKSEVMLPASAIFKLGGEKPRANQDCLVLSFLGTFRGSCKEAAIEAVVRNWKQTMLASLASAAGIYP
ncbi:hypothetical protein HHK36_029518 [Tetracentron sinense]|uniref:Uncharacterized protein n=1 Tax=Tetracentron sinense TaxID=13715 RepID=A0A834YE48_TETSI|nr:hypothetical protein HHK36_029518 [Tetracentron sinense]